MFKANIWPFIWHFHPEKGSLSQRKRQKIKPYCVTITVWRDFKMPKILFYTWFCCVRFDAIKVSVSSTHLWIKYVMKINRPSPFGRRHTCVCLVWYNLAPFTCSMLMNGACFVNIILANWQRERDTKKQAKIKTHHTSIVTFWFLFNSKIVKTNENLEINIYTK